MQSLAKSCPAYAKSLNSTAAAAQAKKKMRADFCSEYNTAPACTRAVSLVRGIDTKSLMKGCGATKPPHNPLLAAAPELSCVRSHAPG